MTQLIWAISFERSFKLKGFYYSYTWSCSLYEGRTSFCMGLISRKLCRFLIVFNWLYFTHCLTSFFSITHLLCLCAKSLILFHLTQMRFSQSTHLDMCLSLETLMSIIRTGEPILVELIDLVNSYNFSFSIDLTQIVNFPTWIPDCDSHSLSLLDFFLLMLLFVLQWLYPCWEILIVFLSQFPNKLKTRCPVSLHSLRPFWC